MRDSVRAAFWDFSVRFEAFCTWCYLDKDGAVTTGVGNKIDSVAEALSLPWLHNEDDTPASARDVADEWARIKARQDMAMDGGFAFQRISRLHLTRAAVAELVDRKLASNERILSGRFANYAMLPADAQLGLHSMAWAMGADFHAPRFQGALRSANFDACAVECHMNDAHNPGLKPRNVADALLFRNAAAVVRLGLDVAKLYYPADVAAMEVPTTPDLPADPDDDA